MQLNPVTIIQRKRDGRELTDKEIHDFVFGLVAGEVEDYQAAAFLMAVYFRGMTPAETVSLTRAMVESGEHYDLSSIPGVKMDKHSTGGVGDKVSLVLAPLAAACGLKIPMMSGRGLGHSGGTLDKLESISGFRVGLTRKEFELCLKNNGVAMIGQSKSIAPADRKLYALRDVTGTVECIPLIVASILSKKIAEGTEGLVLDVKVGNGAFMKTKGHARELAKALVKVAKKLKLPSRALLTNMDQPLGYAVGNALEMKESIEILLGDRNGQKEECGSTDLKELVLQLCAEMLLLAKKSRSLSEGRKLAHSKLADGSAWDVFARMVAAQGGKLPERPQSLPLAQKTRRWTAKKRGYVTRMDTFGLGNLVVEMGGGRKRASDKIDPSVGLVFHKKLGAKVKAGEPIATAYLPQAADEGALESLFQQSVTVAATRKPVPTLIMDHGVKS